MRSFAGRDILSLKDFERNEFFHVLDVARELEPIARSRKNADMLKEKTRSMFSQQELSTVVSDVDADAYDKKVIRDYTRRDGSLKTLPAQQKKLEAILRYVVKAFGVDKRYSEKQVNEMLSRYHEDTATLRRELVGFGLMQREGGGGEYWRIDSR